MAYLPWPQMRWTGGPDDVDSTYLFALALTESFDSHGGWVWCQFMALVGITHTSATDNWHRFEGIGLMTGPISGVMSVDMDGLAISRSKRSLVIRCQTCLQRLGGLQVAQVVWSWFCSLSLVAANHWWENRSLTALGSLSCEGLDNRP